jgi:hypothetical protein
MLIQSKIKFTRHFSLEASKTKFQSSNLGDETCERNVRLVNKHFVQKKLQRKQQSLCWNIVKPKLKNCKLNWRFLNERTVTEVS